MLANSVVISGSMLKAVGMRRRRSADQVNFPSSSSTSPRRIKVSTDSWGTFAFKLATYGGNKPNNKTIFYRFTPFGANE